MVLEIRDKQHLKTQLAEAGDKLVVIDFFATWCGPCKIIAPKIEECSKEFPDVVFLKVNVDDCEEIASECEILRMPTFFFIKNGKKLETMDGNNAQKLKELIRKYK